MMNLKHVLWLLPFLLAGCREQPQWMADLQAGDRTKVIYQKPVVQLFPAKPDQEDTRLIKQAKDHFAGQPQVLGSIASGLKRREREIIGDLVPGAVMTDSQGNLALVYFGRYESPMIMAGVKVLLVFGKDHDLAQVFVYEVPLE
jgi:hypothetical protein